MNKLDLLKYLYKKQGETDDYIQLNDYASDNMNTLFVKLRELTKEGYVEYRFPNQGIWGGGNDTIEARLSLSGKDFVSSKNNWLSKLTVTHKVLGIIVAFIVITTTVNSLSKRSGLEEERNSSNTVIETVNYNHLPNKKDTIIAVEENKIYSPEEVKSKTTEIRTLDNIKKHGVLKTVATVELGISESYIDTFTGVSIGVVNIHSRDISIILSLPDYSNHTEHYVEPGKKWHFEYEGVEYQLFFKSIRKPKIRRPEPITNEEKIVTIELLKRI